MDTSGGVLAFEGHTDDNVYQDVDLVGDGHLTKSQINEDLPLHNQQMFGFGIILQIHLH